MTKEVKSADAATEVKNALASMQDQLSRKYDDLASLQQELKSGMVSRSTLDEHAKAVQAEVKSIIERLAPLEDAVRTNGRPSGSAVSSKSASQIMAEHKDALSVLKHQKGHVSFPAELLDQKAITSANNSAGVLVQADRRPGIVEKPLRPLSIRDIIPSRNTTSNSVEFVRENVFTNNAASVAEGAAKPYSDLSFALTTVPVRTLAHLMKGSVQILDDAAGLLSMAQGRGVAGLAVKEEDQLLSGDGTGVNLTGLIPNATAFVSTGIPGANSSTQTDRVRWAALQVRKNYFPADAVVLNPHDWALIELLKDTTGAYLYSSVLSGATPRLWGMRVVESDAIAEGRFMVGNFSLAAEIADRQGPTVQISNENADDFEKNMVTVRVESRLALQIIRPTAFVYSDKLTGNFS